MKKIALLLTVLATVISAKISVVTVWDSTQTYEGQEIVYYNGEFYLAQWYVKGGKPDSTKAWVKADTYYSAKDFKSDSLYQPGSVVLYGDKKYIARHTTGKDGSYPNKEDEYGAWVMATGALSTLPKDPGLACDTTLLGIDSDGDGIRDDIQIKITQLFPDNPMARAGIFTLFRSYQIDFEKYPLLSTPKFEDFKATTALVGISCDYYELNAHSRISFDDVEQLILNTPERIQINGKIDHLFSCKVIPADGFSEYQDWAKEISNIILDREKERQQ